ncbi:hypothetical protein BN873_210099 [Candidatus Competibacter denitrificans Run_A_D11]|uniref:Uncharacterized protein n=1 Tax=Candidatus Competibacter denitrificans Run_A_D11 TaxID=1400863 RepID=W6MCC4_9GAMM|nr:hypothetical protein BN873_210099 [Candidatus Competibacter denitrificans Run_A_D11]
MTDEEILRRLLALSREWANDRIPLG